MGRVVSSHVGSHIEHTVDFGDAQEVFSNIDLSLADEVACAGDREPIWHDRLTSWVVFSSVGLWMFSAFCLTVFYEGMSDEDGYIILRLQAPLEREPLSNQSLGFVILLQFSCIFLELSLRCVVWFFVAMATAFCYA